MRVCYIYLLFLFALLSCSVESPAQWQTRPFNYGIRGMLNYSSISRLESTILSEPYFINYTLQSKSRWGGGGAVFVNYRADFIGAELEVGYSQQGADLFFNNSEKDFNYRMSFVHQYASFLGRVKLYPINAINIASNDDASLLNGIFVAAGPQVGLPVSNGNIKYTSGGTGRLAAFGTDLEQQQQLRNALKSKTNFGISLAAGLELPESGLAFDFRWFIGISDVVETQANGYNFTETKNINHVAQFTVCWDFSSFKAK